MHFKHFFNSMPIYIYLTGDEYNATNCLHTCTYTESPILAYLGRPMYPFRIQYKNLKKTLILLIHIKHILFYHQYLHTQVDSN